MKKSISIIIPVLNEQGNVKPLVARIDKALKAKDIKYELIFIDDRSVDETLFRLKKLSKQFPIKFYEKKGKKGKAFSLLEGFSKANHDLIAMIDADLQYPPEAIPEMMDKINDQIGIVVANRSKSSTDFLRRFVSRMFLFPFGKILHGFDCDVQSGLKVFKKEIIERIKLNPGPWSFDLEFLVKARNAGYKVDGVEITFNKRISEKAKISLIPAATEIGLSALKLKISPPDIVPFSGRGFHYKGLKFIHHSELDEKESAVRSFTLTQKIFILTFFLIIISSLLINWITAITIIVAVLTVIYFADLIFNLFLIVRSFSKAPEINIVAIDYLKTKNNWPKYSILCPLYREWEVLPQFVNAISRMDYPKDKLQVLLLLEEDDKDTVSHVKNYALPDYFETVIVPDSLPKTKPKALNYGLKKATGEYVVVYDAEDIPDPKQLKKAVLAFGKTDKKTVCIQAKLNFYNPRHNILTRIFTAEYSLWFDLILTGLQSIVAPIPLGGTSNHFRKTDLLKLKGWDSFNVTEDCDLGVRLVKHGYRTALINSLTLEEANSDPANWFRQRTRWIKGYLQTYLVHMRKPKELIKNWREPHLLTFQLIVGGKILSMFINPFMWLTTILYFSFRSTLGVFIQQFFPAPVLYMGVFSLVFGNFLYMYYYMIGSAKRGHFDIIKYVFLVPFYWLSMSVAAWLAVVQLIRRPHFWPKTIHGFHIDREKALLQAPVRLKIANKPSFIFNYYHLIKDRSRFISRSFVDLVGIFLPFSKKIELPDNSGKRILVFNWRDTRHSFAGGAEVYIHELAKRWVKTGHSVTVFSGNDSFSPREEIIDGVQVIRRGGFYFVYFWALLYYLFRFRGQYDVIIDSENGIPFFTPLYAKEKKFLLIHHVHQEVFLKSLKPPFSWLALFLELKLMPFVYKNIQAITVSPSSKKDILDKQLSNIEPIVIYNGVDLNKFKPGVKSRVPLVLYLGRLKPYKSVYTFIHAAKQILENIPKAKFVIAGDGEEKDNLIGLAKRIGIFDKISFMGKVSEEEKILLYQKAWVFVNPSMMEGWGITSIEANACGTPVVASDVPGLRDSVKNPSTGFLVPHNDVQGFAEKIILLLKDKNLRTKFSLFSIIWAQKFDWQKSADKSLELFK